MSKRSPTPTPSTSPSKRLRLSTKVILQQMNGDAKEIWIDKAAAAITPNDVYQVQLAAGELDNSFDLARLHISEEDGQGVVTASLDSQTELRRRDRKNHLSSYLDDLEKLKRFQKERDTEELIRLKHPSGTHYRKILNDIVYNPIPSIQDRQHRGDKVLTTDEVERLKKAEKRYITDLWSWNPITDKNRTLKANALSCLTGNQQKALEFLLHPEIFHLSRKSRNRAQHPQPSTSFAKASIDTVFRESPRQSAVGLDTFFDEDVPDAPDQLRQKVFALEEEMKFLEACIKTADGAVGRASLGFVRLFLSFILYDMNEPLV
ncbi:hypothetical protein C8J56DRAFT_880503 [Mycena floridula]|nr:hypothetical protein C8J56DRAFT_880503 [Mycena floridula]